MAELALHAPRSSARLASARRLRIALRKRHRPFWKQLAVSTGFVIAGDLLLGLLVSTGLWLTGIDFQDLSGTQRRADAGTILSAVVLAPVLETFLLSAGAAVLRRASRSAMFVATCSGLVWGAVHALDGPVRMVFAGWAFFVFTHAYLTFSRCEYWPGFFAAAAPHATLNGVLMLLLLFA